MREGVALRADGQGLEKECTQGVMNSMEVTRKVTVVTNMRAECEGPTGVRVVIISEYT